MKKSLITLLIFSLIIAISGCTNKNTQIPQVINENTSPSDKEIDMLYQKALKIFSWFELGTLNADTTQEKVVGNMAYFKVTEEISKYQELIDMMNSVFDDKIVKNLLLKNIYINVDGELYGILADRGTDIHKGKESYQIIRKNDKEIDYNVTVEILDDKNEITGHKTYNFNLHYCADGKWRFEEFYMIR